jgi:tripartite-type tricarboxylate transporter receptor subunit TctC
MILLYLLSLRRFMVASCFVLLVFFASDAPAEIAWGQAPKTIKLVVPVPAGGPQDTLARMLADQIRQMNGTTLVVENRPGAANLIATEAVARAAPDGATLLIHASAFLIGPLLRKVDYDPFRSFEPICRLVDAPIVLVVNSASPYRTLADFVAAARARPGELTLASVGPGTPHQIAFEMFKRAAGIDVVYVPYSGDAPALTALLGEHLTSMITGLSSVNNLIQTGKLRPLATTTPARLADLPDVPTMTELGYANIGMTPWYGTLAPAKTSMDILAQLNSWFSRALQAPEVQAKLASRQMIPVGECGSDYAAFLRKQNAEIGRVIREADIKAE